MIAPQIAICGGHGCERSERNGNEGRQKAWLLTCHVHTYGAAAHGFGLTPSPLSVGLPRLRLRLRRYRAPYHFHALPGVLIFGYASMNHPRLCVCRPPDSQIRLAALAGLGRDENGLRRGEECPLGMVKNLPAADGEEQLAL